MPRDLTPNDPRKRFEHVLKTYWSKSYKGESLNGAVLDTFYVTTSLLGEHGLSHKPDDVIDHEPGSLSTRYHTAYIERVQHTLDGPEDDRGQPLDIRDLLPESAGAHRIRWAAASNTMLARLGQPYEYDKQGIIHWDGEQWGLADLVRQVVKLPDHAPRDFLIPWVARELVKLVKAVIDASVTDLEYEEAVRALYDKAPAIAQWAKETRTDIGKVDLAQALEAISTYKFKESLVEQGVVIYTFADGWTVQELRTERALTQEGDQMQNCIGGYFEDVSSGNTRIYSIRDASGQPHVSMELKVPPGPSNYGSELSPEEFVRSPERLRWHFEQILGKQNDRPIDEYRARAREFIDKVFGKEGLGWIIAGGAVKQARLAGRKLDQIDFGNVLDVNHVADESPLSGADFTGSSLTYCHFTGGVELIDCNFSECDLSNVKFERANLTRVTFDGAKCHFTEFIEADLREASFRDAHCGGADFRKAQLSEAAFVGANVDGARFGLSHGGRLADWKGTELTETQRTQLNLPQAPGDYRGEAARRREQERRT